MDTRTLTLLCLLAILLICLPIACGVRLSYKRVGGLLFIRVGRLSLSFCITRS